MPDSNYYPYQRFQTYQTYTSSSGTWVTPEWIRIESPPVPKVNIPWIVGLRQWMGDTQQIYALMIGEDTYAHTELLHFLALKPTIERTAPWTSYPMYDFVLTPAGRIQVGDDYS
jgi:hypothetical protein